MALLGAFWLFGFFVYKIPELEYSGYSYIGSCTGECYEEYVALNGTPAEIEQRKRALAEGDPFSSIRSLWAGCAQAPWNRWRWRCRTPLLAGQTLEDIIMKLTTYKMVER